MKLVFATSIACLATGFFTGYALGDSPEPYIKEAGCYRTVEAALEAGGAEDDSCIPGWTDPKGVTP